MRVINRYPAMTLLWLGVALVLAMTACNATTSTTEEVAAEESVQTATVRQGDIIISATGAGTVIPATEVQLSFPAGGRLAELHVSVGDQVNEGDVLAVLDDTDAAASLANAELQYATSVLQTDAASTQTGISYNEIAVEQAQISLEEAQAELADLLAWEPDEDAIALAEAQLAAAKAGYSAALGQQSQSSNDIQVAQIGLEQAERNLATAQSAYDTAFDPGRDWELTDPRRKSALEAERNGAERALQNAQDNLLIEQAQYNSTVAGQSNSSAANAQTSVLSAEQALASAQSGPTDEEIEVAEQAVRLAELAYQQALLNRESDGIGLRQAELNLQTAQEAVDGTNLLAPFAGTITAVAGHVGEQVSGTIITLADLSQPLLEVYVDETDLDKMAVGYPADVIFDAFPDDTVSGTVVAVDPVIVTTNGVSAVRALVQLDAGRLQTLPVGLNASVDIIGGEALNAPLVPVEALREIAPGQYVVFVMHDGAPVMTPVEVGLSNFAFAEILSGVEPGDTVTTGVIQTE